MITAYLDMQDRNSTVPQSNTNELIQLISFYVLHDPLNLHDATKHTKSCNK